MLPAPELSLMGVQHWNLLNLFGYCQKFIKYWNVASITYGLPQTEWPGFEDVNMHAHACQLASLRDSRVRGDKACFNLKFTATKEKMNLLPWKILTALTSSFKAFSFKRLLWPRYSSSGTVWDHGIGPLLTCDWSPIRGWTCAPLGVRY